jgi:hypothetical protein
MAASASVWPWTDQRGRRHAAKAIELGAIAPQDRAVRLGRHIERPQYAWWSVEAVVSGSGGQWKPSSKHP